MSENICEMIIRQAKTDDIPMLQSIRNSVRENVLTDPSRITAEHYKIYLEERGKGWVCEINRTIAGFAIVDIIDHNVWALFLHPDHEKQGIGQKLHNTLLNWYFSQTTQTIWLSTDAGTRAELFYKKAGWKKAGLEQNGEIRFEMAYENWKTHSL